MPDIDMFYKNPTDDLSAAMQDRIFNCRFDQYLNALAHIINTGLLGSWLVPPNFTHVTCVCSILYKFYV